MKILKQVMIDLAKEQIKAVINQTKTEKGLSVYDIETILYQLLLEVKSEKELNYSANIIDLANQLQAGTSEAQPQVQKED